MISKKLLLSGLLLCIGSVASVMANPERGYAVSFEYINAEGQRVTETKIFTPDLDSATRQALAYCKAHGFTDVNIVTINEGCSTSAGLIFNETNLI